MRLNALRTLQLTRRLFSERFCAESQLSRGVGGLSLQVPGESSAQGASNGAPSPFLQLLNRPMTSRQ